MGRRPTQLPTFSKQVAQVTFFITRRCFSNHRSLKQAQSTHETSQNFHPISVFEGSHLLQQSCNTTPNILEAGGPGRIFYFHATLHFD